MYAQNMQEGYGHLSNTARYQATSLIGNWSEERELRRSILKDALARKMSGSLRLDAYHQRMQTALAEVELTRMSDDAYVHTGDIVQLVHLETGSTVAGNVHETDPRPGEEACAATAAVDIRSPCARNTFVILKYKPSKSSALEPYYEDDALRYGQKIRMALNPAANSLPLDSDGGPRPLCLFSKTPSTNHFAKYSRKQLVGLTYRDTFDTVWQVVTPDPSHRLVSEGVEVLAGAPILLVHCQTQMPLIVEDQRYPSEYGSELELSARQSTSAGMKLSMELTAKGILRGSLPKAENSLNYFTFITGSKVERLPNPSSSDEAADTIMSALVADVASRSGALSLLQRKLVMLSNQNNELPADELLLLVRQVGATGFSEYETQILAKRFSAGKPGIVDASRFLKSVRDISVQ